MSATDSTLQLLVGSIAEQVAAQVRAEILTHMQRAGSRVQPALLSVKDAAVYLGRSEQAVQHLIFQKELPVVRAGRRVHLDRKDLERERGLQLASDAFRQWAVVGNWIEVFKPEFLFIAACEAGQLEAVRAIFGSVPSLQQIYASPAKIGILHASPMGILLFKLLADGKLNAGIGKPLRALGGIATGVPIYHWRRDDTGPGTELQGKLMDAPGQFASGRSASRTRSLCHPQSTSYLPTVAQASACGAFFPNPAGRKISRA